MDNVSVTTTGAGLGLTPSDTDGDGSPDFIQTDAAGTDAVSVALNPLVTGLNTVISGTGAPGATVVLTDVNGDPIALIDDMGVLISPAEIVVSADGTWSAIPETPLSDGTEVSATQTDAPGFPTSNSSDTETLALDSDGDDVRDTIDIDDDNDGILDINEFSVDSQGFNNIDFSNTSDPGDIIGVNGTNAVTGGITNGATNQDQGTSDGILRLGVAGNSQATYSLGFNEPTNVVVDYPPTGSNFLFTSNETLTLSVAPGSSLTITNPSGQLLIDTNNDGVFESDVTSFTGETISFQVSSGSLSFGSGDFQITSDGPISQLDWTYISTSSGNNGASLRFQAEDVTANFDTDGDTIINRLDTDSDNGGIDDNIEGQNGQPFIAASGIDSDGNGLDDAYESVPGAGEGITPADTDGDGTPDHLETNDAGLDTIGGANPGPSQISGADGDEDILFGASIVGLGDVNGEVFKILLSAHPITTI